MKILVKLIKFQNSIAVFFKIRSDKIPSFLFQKTNQKLFPFVFRQNKLFPEFCQIFPGLLRINFITSKKTKFVFMMLKSTAMPQKLKQNIPVLRQQKRRLNRLRNKITLPILRTSRPNPAIIIELSKISLNITILSKIGFDQRPNFLRFIRIYPGLFH